MHGKWALNLSTCHQVQNQKSKNKKNKIFTSKLKHQVFNQQDLFSNSKSNNLASLDLSLVRHSHSKFLLNRLVLILDNPRLVLILDNLSNSLNNSLDLILDSPNSPNNNNSTLMQPQLTIAQHLVSCEYYFIYFN